MGKKETNSKGAPQTSFSGKINKYGFLRFSKALYQTLGLQKGEDIPVTITVNPDGSAIVQRAS